MLILSARGWIEINRVGGTAGDTGLVRLKALKGLSLGRERIERIVKPGETFEADGATARELLRQGRAEVVEPGPEAA